MKHFISLILAAMLSACGFHLQGDAKLSPALHTVYLQTPDPYGVLARNLEQTLKMSHVVLVSNPEQAQTILAILNDDTSQELLSVSGTQQTRQYRIKVTVAFSILDKTGRTLVAPTVLEDSRIMTIQSNQILGSSNEANLFYQQIRRSLASSIINRIASKDVTTALNKASTQDKNIHP